VETPPQVVYARASTVVVKVDAASGKPVRFSVDERKAFEEYLDEPIRLRR
jgi:acyl-CoA thioester hydrolase